MTKEKDQNTTLPKDLAGYQQVVFGKTQEGDLVLDEPGCSSPDGYFIIGHLAGRDIEHINPEIRIYRKMPCPKQSDAHEREMANAKCTSPVHIGMGLMGCPTEPVVATDHPIGWTPNGPEYRAIPGKDNRQVAKTYDEGKPPLAHLPWGALREVALVQAYGHSKYGDFYNYKKGMEVSRNLGCAMRHMTDYMAGNDWDDESKRHHLAHAACRILFALQNIYDKKEIDDRYRRS